MANYVFNSIFVDGKPEDVKRFFTSAKATYTQTYVDWETPSAKSELFTKTVDSEFSFRSFVQPPSQDYDDYYTPTGGLIQSWYHWNIDNWGTKWDAGDVCVDLENSTVAFTTAWSPPIPVFQAIIKQFPNLSFDFHYEEEQGWGGEIFAKNGVITEEKQWDIPNSHADNEALARDCQCDYEDDSEYWYDDCPRKIELLQSDPSAELAKEPQDA
jgi:hypothetical protein